MATLKSSQVKGTNPAPSPTSQAPVISKTTIAVPAANVVAGDVLQLAVLPAGAVPVGYVISFDDLDSNGTPTVAADFGILNAAGTAVSADAADGGAKWLTASQLGRTGGNALHTASKSTYDILNSVKAVDADRIVGVVFTASAATGAAGNVYLELSYK